MLPSTTYEMRDVFSDGTTSAPLLFTTGAIPSTVGLPAFTVPQPPGPGSDLDQDMIVQQPVGTGANLPALFATDLTGRVTWYENPPQADFIPNLPGGVATLVPGGTVLVIGGDSHRPFPTSLNVLRETDLASNPLRETNLDAVNAQLTAMGHEVIYSFTHDVQRLPNGQTAVVGLTERTVNINGTPTNYVGDMIVVLDKNFQVTWAWDAFDYLDVNRGPTLGETVQPGVVGPASAVPNLPAVDWLHLNAVSWSPGDDNLILSIRHQDWVLKVDYRNGEGDGHIIWRLGQGGDFTVNSTDPNPWFSHQHDAHLIDPSTLILFDNGNVRQASDPNAHSRGQVWKLDERTMTATLVLNVDLGNYSMALGAAQRLSNGNYSFDSGWQGQAPKFFAQSIEVRPDGSKAYVLEINNREYRNFRTQTLYQGISDQLAGDGGGETSPHGDDSQDHSRGDGHRGDGSPGASAPAQYAELGALRGTSSSISVIATGSLPDDFRPAVAVALTASSRPLPLSPTQTTQTAGDVQRLDRLFAAGLEEGISLVLPRSKWNWLRFTEEDTVL
jgi:hypothetical protein